MKEIIRYSHCFVCGDKNESGLKARFFQDGDKARTELTADEKFEGYRGIYHGGILSSLLDEVMIKAILAQDHFVVTAELTVKFLKPVTTGQPLVISGWIVQNRRRLFVTEGVAESPEGTVFATAEAKYIEAGDSLRKRLLNSIG